MAQIESKPILSLCIPIYNRLSYLERQLARMLEDKELFDGQIQLIVSDNCSTDNLQSCCEKYQQQGLNLMYHRNETNLGPDGNFDWCFHHAEGKYVWLLGSDDIPMKGLFQEVVEILEGGNYGLVHLSTSPREERQKLFHNDNGILTDINVWITFMSANIIRTDTVRDFDLKEYIGSYMIQVPAYLNACLSSEDNALVCPGKLFEDGSDAANNGGYNLFKVFVENLFGMYQNFIDKGRLSKQSFECLKRVEYKDFLVGYIVRLLVLRKRGNFDTTDAFSILWKHYSNKPYAYYYLGRRLLAIPVKRALQSLLNILLR